VASTDGFRVTYPCWLIVTEDSVTSVDGKAKLADPIRFVALQSDAGEQSLAVFTNRDAVQAFVDSAEGMGEVPIISAANRDAGRYAGRGPQRRNHSGRLQPTSGHGLDAPHLANWICDTTNPE
jgi:hypothetical protein